MDRDTIISYIKEGSSPTQKFLVEYFPEGSEVSRIGIQNIYAKKSESQIRLARTGRVRNNSKRSVVGSRRNRAGKFFNKMVKIGYWKSV